MKRGFSYFLVFRKKERGKKKKKSSKVRDRQRNHLNENICITPQPSENKPSKSRAQGKKGGFVVVDDRCRAFCIDIAAIYFQFP